MTAQPAPGSVSALVLAAGLGTRLRPLTTLVPKPLLPVGGVPLLARTLVRLDEVGCQQVAVNLHHLGEAIRGHFGSRFGRMRLTWSPEPEILGTLGALGPVRGVLGQAETVLVVNGDSLCDWPFEELLARHRETGAAATLLFAAGASAEEFGGGCGLDAEGRVVSLRAGLSAVGTAVAKRVFAGAHALSASLLERVPNGPADFVTELYQPLLEEGAHLAACETDRPWHDLGTPDRYRLALLDWAARHGQGGSWFSQHAQVAPEARIERSVLEVGARVEAEATVSASVVLPGAVVGRGARVERSIVAFRAEVPAGATLVDQLVMPATAAGLE
ncbi:MAG TPA: NDP-sugar synthase [Thermoanaerobaculia bacterium]|nr:NDP-sugar synthase [Thermoanaerobaculia bacterium]